MTPRLSVFIAASLDGYIATPDGKLDWLTSAASPDEDYGYEAFMATVDAVAMGRRTFDFAATIDLWPVAGKPVFVFTHLPPAPCEGVTFWAVSPREALARWSAADFERVYVDGGELIDSFLVEGLIDDLRVAIVPILLGEGIPLFHPHAGEARLKLSGSKVFPSGMVTLCYVREA